MTYINTNRFILDPYRSGGSNRFACPQCGKRKCFTRYIDTETGEYLAEECGRCDHEASCGYHYTPSELFHDRPECRPQDNSQPYCINGKTTVLSRMAPRAVVVAEPVPQTLFFPISWAEGGVVRESVLSSWLESLGYDKERVRSVREEYYLGATAKDTFVEGVNYGPAAVFWMIDEKQQVHDAKLMAFRADGHRVQGWGNSMRSICKNSGKGPQLENTDKCFFGLHLITRHLDKPVCIVESEKTALVCACRYPEYVWLATGGCNLMKPENLKPLMDRRVIVYPDSGKFDEWAEVMRKSGHANYKMIDFLEAYEPNTDIVDVLMGEAVLKDSGPQKEATGEAEPPTLLPAANGEHSVAQKAADDTWQRMKDDNPALQMLADRLGLELEPPTEPCPF